YLLHPRQLLRRSRWNGSVADIDGLLEGSNLKLDIPIDVPPGDRHRVLERREPGQLGFEHVGARQQTHELKSAGAVALDFVLGLTIRVRQDQSGLGKHPARRIQDDSGKREECTLS